MFLLAMMASSGALGAAPVLEALEAPSPLARGLVVVRGQGLEKARIVWDADTPSQRTLRGGFQGATMFSIPPGTPAGAHAVRVENEDGRSATATLNVTSVAPNAVPRIDHVTLVATKFEANGTVGSILYVQGPNMDVGAKVLVDGAESPSDAHKALFNDLFGADPSVLGYPIRHYLAHIVPLAARPAGSEVRIQIRNEGGETSAERTFRLPTDAASLDSDGDGIPDVVELNGFDRPGTGTNVVDLKSMGADPFRKDVFVEVDVMDGVTYPPMQRQGARPGTFDLAREMFANAPILNPFGPGGINLVVDATGTVLSWDLLEFRAAHDQTRRVGSFAVLKRDNFTAARQGVFHYAIWGRAHPSGWSGESNIDFEGTGVGDEFMVTMDEFPPEFQTLKSQAATFVHELGHDLGQRHGGDNHSRYKPNYWSVMAYAWQLRTGWPDTSRRQIPTCTQIYYATKGATEVNGALPNVPGFVIDYSEGMGPELVTNNGSLDERTGVCGQPVDWNKDGTIGEGGTNAAIDSDDPGAIRVADRANWSKLRFEGPRLGGKRQP